ncbi:serine/arginine-rich splicing factor SC35 [Amborella trichopoda]|uniref:RRM domain-containing protein n=1 Tax=Amborella trichopoda TaxID=13333 RepID=W1NTW6_AMBTC|nr:serine/arginine-rich splicing factor SC35 [Amborella trichopoda]XP_011621481.1 serine/arginine-rich splicing factor SC35 [Amborella trichopoda]XP_011621483.1 serine/arginine-rich splicing factor SC35 [Amborella trichopoda]XP_020520102.1 serine/arginine-rich splicing factor SC35 [Amborella trichopoda]XP_020520103.1 serine/arginine-rich splicing factor SC35 [Amborella trichopoda]ERN01032.1 hypothetical protein AMTR_s00002p00145180 [Amborella trichopoda]|eukprot:XP_011621480.1 serine/arginine-rich splicing factor SC35 [Amborella trichopoda]
MSHFGRSGPPDIRDTFSLLVLNITFRTAADDLFPLFDRCGKVVDIFIPRDKRTGESRGFAFVRYKYADEAQMAVERLDGRNVDGRDIMVQFAKYGPNAERIHKGRIVEVFPKSRGRSRSYSPRRRYRDDYDRDYRRRSRSRERYYDRDRYRGKERDYRYRSRSRSLSPDYNHGRGRGREYDNPRSRSRSYDSASPARRSLSPRKSRSLSRSPSDRNESPRKRSPEWSPSLASLSPRRRPADSRSPSPNDSTDGY